MDKPGPSTSKVYHPRMETRNNGDTTIPELVNDSDSDRYEDGASDEIIEDFEYSSTSSSSEKRASSSSTAVRVKEGTMAVQIPTTENYAKKIL
jgi:hypothetical protein